MKIFLASIFVMCFVASVVGDGCSFDGKKYKAGEVFYPPGQCTKNKCHDDGGVSALTCAAMVAPGCKRIPADNSKPYPECCEHYEC